MLLSIPFPTEEDRQRPSLYERLASGSPDDPSADPLSKLPAHLILRAISFHDLDLYDSILLPILNRLIPKITRRPRGRARGGRQRRRQSLRRFARLGLELEAPEKSCLEDILLTLLPPSPEKQRLLERRREAAQQQEEEGEENVNMPQHIDPWAAVGTDDDTLAWFPELRHIDRERKVDEILSSLFQLEWIQKLILTTFWCYIERDITRTPLLLFQSSSYCSPLISFPGLLRSILECGCFGHRAISLAWRNRRGSSRARLARFDRVWEGVGRRVRFRSLELCVGLSEESEEEGEEEEEDFGFVFRTSEKDFERLVNGNETNLRNLTLTFSGDSLRVSLNSLRKLNSLSSSLKILKFDNSVMSPRRFDGLSNLDLDLQNKNKNTNSLSRFSDPDPFVCLKKLQHLSLFWSFDEESKGLLSSMRAKAYKNLTSLALTFCHCDFDRLRCICRNMPSLLRLDLSGSRFVGFDRSMDQFCLILFGSDSEEEEEEEGDSYSYSSLRSLICKDVVIEPRGPRIWPSDDVAVSLFQGTRFRSSLEKFDVSAVEISPEFLSALILNSPKLKFLVLDRCRLTGEHYDVLDRCGGQTWCGSDGEDGVSLQLQETLQTTIELSLRAHHRVIPREMIAERTRRIVELREKYPSWTLLTK